MTYSLLPALGSTPPMVYDDVKINVRPPALSQDSAIFFVSIVDRTCPFAKTIFKQLITESFDTKHHTAYVVAYLWDQTETGYFADATALHNQMSILHTNGEKTLKLPNTNTEIKKIDYFVISSNNPVLQWTLLETVNVKDDLKPSLFIEDYIYCSSSNVVPTAEVLKKRHHIINHLIFDNNSQELYYWLQRTANDFEDDPYTYAVLDQFFTLHKSESFNGQQALQERITYIKCKDRQRACSLSIINIFKLCAGAVASHFTPPEAHIGILSGYFFTRLVLRLCFSNSPDVPPYKGMKAVNTFFLGFFLGGSIEEIAAMALSPRSVHTSDYIDTLTSILGLVSTKVGWDLPEGKSRFENLRRCWDNVFL